MSKLNDFTFQNYLHFFSFFDFKMFQIMDKIMKYIKSRLM